MTMVRLATISCMLPFCFLRIATGRAHSRSDTGSLRGSTARILDTNLFTCVDNVCKEGFHKFYFNYSFADGCILQGYTTTTDLFLEYCDGSTIKLDISCAYEYSDDGFSKRAEFGPIKGEHSALIQYTIKTIQDNCACAQYCFHTTPLTSQQTPNLPFNRICEGVTCFDGFHCNNGRCIPSDSNAEIIFSSKEENSALKNSAEILSGKNATVGEVMNAQGCKVSAGYLWCEVLHKCIQPWITICPNLSVEPDKPALSFTAIEDLNGTPSSTTSRSNEGSEFVASLPDLVSASPETLNKLRSPSVSENPTLTPTVSVMPRGTIQESSLTNLIPAEPQVLSLPYPVPTPMPSTVFPVPISMQTDFRPPQETLMEFKSESLVTTSPSGDISSHVLASVQLNVSSSNVALTEKIHASEIRFDLMTLDQKLIATQTCKCKTVTFFNITPGTYELHFSISGYRTFNETLTVLVEESSTHVVIPESDNFVEQPQMVLMSPTISPTITMMPQASELSASIDQLPTKPEDLPIKDSHPTPFPSARSPLPISTQIVSVVPQETDVGLISESVITSHVGGGSSDVLASVQFNITSSSEAMMKLIKDAEIQFDLRTLDHKLIATQTCTCLSATFSNVTQGTYELIYTISGFGTVKSIAALTVDRKEAIPEAFPESDRSTVLTSALTNVPTLMPTVSIMPH